MRSLPLCAAVICVTAALTGCSTSRGYESAFSDKQSLQGNSHTVQATATQTFGAVTGTLVQKGFNIEQADADTGLIKATRNYSDPKNPNTNYHIVATAYVSALSAKQSTLVTLSASQQTVLYRKGHSWTMLPLLPIIPIPTGKKFETVTTGEGGIVSSVFYDDFFAALERTLAAEVTPAIAERTASDDSAR
jgi:hypothetical protein